MLLDCQVGKEGNLVDHVADVAPQVHLVVLR